MYIYAGVAAPGGARSVSLPGPDLQGDGMQAAVLLSYDAPVLQQVPSVQGCACVYMHTYTSIHSRARARAHTHTSSPSLSIPFPLSLSPSLPCLLSCLSPSRSLSRSLSLPSSSLRQVTPSSGDMKGGARVDIVGANFGSVDAGLSVFVGLSVCASQTWTSDSSIACVVGQALLVHATKYSLSSSSHAYTP
jgi:hypothetical protein